MSSLNKGMGGSGASGVEFSWRDIVLNAMIVILLLLIMVLFRVNPPKKEDATEVDKSPGNVIVELSWDNTRNIDLDLWVQAPGDTPVGYSALAGKVFNLLRDDLGKQSDLTDVNLENAYSRGIPAGEYVVNVHDFRHDGGGPLEATVIVRTKANASAPSVELLATKLTLKGNGQELTAFRFTLDKDGALVPGSVHHVFKPLRSHASGQFQPPGGPEGGDGEPNPDSE